MIYDIHGNVIKKSDVDLKKGRIGIDIVPMEGVMLDPGADPNDLPDELKAIRKIYIPLTNLEIEYFKVAKLSPEEYELAVGAEYLEDEE